MGQLPSMAAQYTFQNQQNDGENAQKRCRGKQQLTELITHLQTLGTCAGSYQPYFVLWQEMLQM